MKEYFKIKELPYGFDYLEPVISKETMNFHYNFHHKSYVNNLNKFLNLDKKYADKYKTLKDVLLNASKFSVEFRNGLINNVGGHINHTMFWNIMTSPKNKKETDIKNYEVGKKIFEDFGSIENFYNEFSKKQLVFLVVVEHD